MTVWKPRSKASVACQIPLLRGRRSKGYVLLMIAAGMTVLMGLAGLALDLGYMEYYRRRVRAAADAGAVGGVRELVANGSSNVVTAAKQDVTTNGFTDGVSGATVTVSIPPSSGTYKGVSGYVQVLVTKNVSPFFMGLLTSSVTTIQARSTGGEGASPYCVIALNRTADAALDVWGNTNVNVSGCAVLSDSSSSTGLTVGNTACLTAKEIDVVGGYSAGSCISPSTPNAGVQPLDDPFSTLSAPTVPATCDYNNYSVNKSAVLSPGVYCGGIKIAGSGTTITFKSGLYILNGGGMFVSGGNTLKVDDNGNGVTFYNTAPDAKSFGDIKFTGTASLDLWAPKANIGDGALEGILFFQDRAYTGSGSSILGDNSSTVDGAIYMKNAALTFSGNSSADSFTNIVANTIKFTGNSNLKSDYSKQTDGPPMRSGALVE